MPSKHILPRLYRSYLIVYQCFYEAIFRSRILDPMPNELHCDVDFLGTAKGVIAFTALITLAESTEDIVAELQTAVHNPCPVINNLDSATAHASIMLGPWDNQK